MEYELLKEKDFIPIGINEPDTIPHYKVNFIELMKKLHFKLGIKSVDTYDIKFDILANHYPDIPEQNNPLKGKICTMKFCPYLIQYGNNNDIGNPTNSEIEIAKLLSKIVFDLKTPGILLPIMILQVDTTFLSTIPEKHIPKEYEDTYKKFIKGYHKQKYLNISRILVYEQYTSLWKYIQSGKMPLINWRAVIFQVFYTLALIQKKYPAFRHNELKPGAIGIINERNINSDSNKYYRFKLEDKTFSLSTKFLQVGIYNFYVSTIAGLVENNLVNADWAPRVGFSSKPNRYHDINYFLNLLIYTYSNTLPQKMIEFIHRVVPKKYRIGSKNVTAKGGLLVDNEYTTPKKVLLTDPYFGRFLKKKKGLIKIEI